MRVPVTPSSSYRVRLSATSGMMKRLAWRWSRFGQSLMPIGRGFAGIGGAGVIMMRDPAGIYLILAGAVWILLWTAFLVSVWLRNPRH